MTQVMSQKMSDEEQNSLQKMSNAEAELQQKVPQNAEQKMSIQGEEKMSILPEKMSIPDDEKMSIQPQNPPQIDILCASSDDTEKNVDSDTAETQNAGDIHAQIDILFEGEVDPTKLEEHGYAIRMPDGKVVDAMCPAEEFDALLEELGFLLLDRVRWPLMHRILIMSQAPRGKDGIFLIERQAA